MTIEYYKKEAEQKYKQICYHVENHQYDEAQEVFQEMLTVTYNYAVHCTADQLAAQGVTVEIEEYDPNDFH